MSDENEAPQMIDRKAMEFAAQLIQKNSDDLQWTNTKLIEGYKHQAETNQATLDAIRVSVQRLFDGPWMPNPDMVLRALWPSDELVDHYRKENDQ